MPELAPPVDLKSAEVKQKRMRASSVMDKNVPKLAESLVPPAKSDGDDDKKRELGEMVVHRKSNAESSIQNDSKDNLKLPSSNSDLVIFDGAEYISCVPEHESFPFFRLHDRNPLNQRKFLFALNQRYLTTSKIDPSANAVMQNTQLRTERSTKKMNLSGKLNAFLRNKKTRKTRAGIFHMISMNIQDNRPKAATSLIDILPESSLTKKRHSDTNRVFLKALSARMEAVCLQMFEKGFPSSPASPIFGTISAEKFAFPSYFQLAVAMELVELKVDVNISWYQLSPIHIACLNGNEKLITLLIDNGANINQGLGLEDMYLLSKLKMSGNAKVIPDENISEIHPKTIRPVVNDPQKDIFRQAGYKGPISVGAEYTQNLIIYPFELAYVKGHLKIANALLEHTSPKIAEIAFFGLLHSKDFLWTKRLIQAKGPINKKDYFGANVLHLACRAGNFNMVIVLVNEKMNLNEPGFRGWTPLHEAASFGHVDVAQYLIYKGANVNSLNDAGESPKAVAANRAIDPLVIKAMFAEKSGQKDVAISEKEDLILKTEVISLQANGSNSPKDKQSRKGLASGIGLFLNSKSSTTSSTSSTSLGGKTQQGEKEKGRRSFFSSSKGKSSEKNL